MKNPDCLPECRIICVPMAVHELYTEKEVTVQDAKEHGLTEEEFEKIQEYLGGRLPTVTELGVYSGLWSEHASYKNSILHLKTFPTESPRSMTKAGEENAGALDIGDGLAVVFKIESHNHPTAVEPYQGAATGVGGIMRDIFTMGARPICSLNSLRFGPPDSARNRYLLRRAVKGIGDYGNCLGVAVSGGELFFDKSFSRNCLVNAMTVGIVEHGKMASAEASGKGNPVIYVGSTTGRDGIHGASFASMDLSAETESKRSAVQVGDPFMEKLLLEATLELIASKALVGIQDMGAAGLACATSEMSAKGNVGMDVDLDLIPFREEGMSAYEIMLSESQERMLVVGKEGREEEIYSIFKKWGLHAVKIGTVTDDGMIRLRRFNKICAEIPAHSLVLGGGAPRYKRDSVRPGYLDSIKNLDLSEIPDTQNPSEDLMNFIASNNISSRRPLYDQYDTEVGLVKIIGPGGDGGLARIPGTDKGIAVAADCNSRYVYADPRRGAAHAVIESARNVAATGSRPIGITNNLNFANPYIPENYYMFTESVGGIRDACEILDLPVTGGNVSFYNESDDGPIFPTPTIGMVGYMEDVHKAIRPGFKAVGDIICLLGKFKPELGMSEFLSWKYDTVRGEQPELDLKYERSLIEFILNCTSSKFLKSVKDISLGGFAIALVKAAFGNEVNDLMGFSINLDFIMGGIDFLKRKDTLFFGETNGSYIISVDPDSLTEIQTLSERMGVDLTELGTVTGDGIFDFGLFKLNGSDVRHQFESGLQDIF